MDKLIKCIYDPECTLKWDKLLKESNFQQINNSKSFGIIYTQNKGQYGIASRDFYDKVFKFYHNGKYYRYTSYIQEELIGSSK